MFREKRMKNKNLISKLILVVALVLLGILSSCSTQTETKYVCSDGSIVENSNSCYKGSNIVELEVISEEEFKTYLQDVISIEEDPYIDYPYIEEISGKEVLDLGRIPYDEMDDSMQAYILDLYSKYNSNKGDYIFSYYRTLDGKNIDWVFVSYHPSKNFLYRSTDAEEIAFREGWTCMTWEDITQVINSNSFGSDCYTSDYTCQDGGIVDSKNDCK